MTAAVFVLPQEGQRSPIAFSYLELLCDDLERSLDIVRFDDMRGQKSVDDESSEIFAAQLRVLLH